MNDNSRPASLTNWQGFGVIAAVIVITGSMLGGFWSSFHNLSDAAATHGWQHPALLPLGIDLPIVAFVILDQVAITLHSHTAARPGRAGWLHYVAWGLAAFTVWANAAVAPPDGSVWRIIYAAQPALWVLGVAALRHFWKLWRKGPAKPADKIPAGRWIANPFTAAALQRRMWLLSETSWARMSLLEDARQFARDLIRAGEKQDRDVPAMLRSRIRSGRLHESVLAAIDARLADPTSTGIEAAVQAWVASLMVLPELVSADLRKAVATTVERTVAADPAASSDVPAQRTTPRPRQRTPDFTRKPAKAAAAKMSGTDLAPYVQAWVDAGNAATIKGVSEAFHVGEPKAKLALTTCGLWGPDAPVLAINGAR